MNRLHKRRIDNTKKRKLIPVFEVFSNGSIVKIHDKVKTYSIKDLPPNRLITFETDPNDVWSETPTPSQRDYMSNSKYSRKTYLHTR